MEHLDDKQLLELATDGSAECALRAHVEGCEGCRRRLEALNAVGQAPTVVTSRDGRDTEQATQPTVPDRPDGAQASPSPLTKGTTVGRYVLLERLGSGGMGEVFAAYDPQLDRKVALKLLRPGVVSPDEGRSRLLREAQAMARLNHPNVISVHDVGTFGDRVFVTMEFVEGQTLSDWLREVRPWPEVLSMFVAAGRGLAAAHSSGLVHRDFKPDNVLVGKDGRPRVLDFGLARQAASVEPTPGPVDLEQPLSSRALERPLTRAGAIMGTPGYMAPEQLHGLPTDARTDQFSFCVALYEALFHRRPFEGATLAEVAAAIARQEVPEPPRDSDVPGRVFEVLCRGLKASPDARWPSMDALLSALSVDERRSRYRWLFAGALAIALLGAAGTSYGLYARGRLKVCRGASAKLQGVWDGARRAKVREAFSATRAPFAADSFSRVEQVLDGYTRAWVALSVEACEATRIRGTESDETFALKTLCLEERLHEVRALVELLSKADDEVVSNAVRAARSLGDLRACADAVALKSRRRAADPQKRAELDAVRARLLEAKALYGAGKYPRSAEAIRPAVESARAMKDRSLEAEALLLLGQALDRSGDPKSAEAALLESALAAEAGRNDEVAVRAFSRLVSVVGYTQARHETARLYARVAQAALERHGKSDELEAELHTDLGHLALAEGRYADARRELEAALELRSSALGEQHPEVAMAHNNLGVALAKMGRLEESIEHYERALALHQKTLGPDHPMVATSMNNRGVIYSRLGRLTEALDRYQAALRIREQALGSEHPEVAASLQALGNIYPKLGRDAEALEHHQRALAIRLRAYGPDHRQVGDSYQNLAAALLAMGQPKRALEYAQSALAIFEKALGPTHPSTSSARETLGLVYLELGQHDRARGELEKALFGRQHALGPDHPTVASSHNSLGDLALAIGRPDRALEHYRQALAIREKNVGPDNATLSYDLVGVARAYVRMKNPSVAVGYYERALTLRERADNPLELAAVRFELAQALDSAHRDRERSLELARQARETYARAKEKGRAEVARIDAWLSSRTGTR